MDEVRAILINLVVPVAGVWLFLRLRRRMLNAEIEEAPVIPLFILFATYGGLIIALLTALFCCWSGMATLGLAYLLLVAPVVMPALAIVFYRRRRLSSYHAAVFWLSAGYVPGLFLLGVARVLYYGLSWREFF
jgi:hypothetical protein